MNRRTLAIRQFVGISLAGFAVLFVVAKCTGCTPPLTSDDKKAIAFDAVRIAVCQSYGRECKRNGGSDCFGLYDDCILDAGLREGSAR